jgi:chemotaxis protein methyltransferase CheR
MIWSAGCSTGEEPYTIAMVVEEYRRINPSFYFSLFASDISTKVLSTAVDAVYDEDKADPVTARV